MLHFFGSQGYFKKVSQNEGYFKKVSQNERYFKKVSQNERYFKNFLFFYFFGFPKELLQKTTWIELINVLHFNEKKIDFLNNTKQYLLLFNNDQ